MKRTSGNVVVILVAIAMVLAGLAFWQFRAAETAKRQLGLDATRMVAEVFNTKRDLRVGQLSGVIEAKSENDGTIFDTTQLTRAPATVNYLLDLEQIGADDLEWNGDEKTMTVRIPDVTVEAPNIDMSRAEVEQAGIWISRDASKNLQKRGVERIKSRANERARTEKNLETARRSALDGVRKMVAQPLAAAGIEGVRVEVLFPWQGNASSEQMDRSRSLEEVLGNRR